MSKHTIHKNYLYFLDDLEYSKLLKKKIIFIRHANSLCNSYKGTVSERRIDKSLLDSPLTELGKTQSLELQKQLLDISDTIDLVVSSSLSRAMETAALIFKDRKIKLLDILGETVGGWGDVGQTYLKRLSRNNYFKEIKWDLSESNYGIGDLWEKNDLWELVNEGDNLLARPYETLESTNNRIKLFWKWLANNTNGYHRIAIITHSKLLGRPENNYGILLSRAKLINRGFNNCECVEVNFI